MSETANFLGYESATIEKSLFTIIPAPCEDGVTYLDGQAAAPRAIIDASTQIESYDEETGIDLITKDAIHCLSPEAAPQGRGMDEWITTNVNKAIDAVSVPIILGGDGTISKAAIKALAEQSAKGNQELSILHIDAHADLNLAESGENNLTTMRQVLEMGLKVSLCQIGVRSLSRSAFDLIADEDQGIDCFFMSDLRHSTDDDWQDDIVSALSSPVYISIDLSAFDPSLVPNVGNPEPGGFTWNQITRLLKKIACHRRIAAIDIVELCPREGDIVSDYTAARLVYKAMNYICSGGKMLPKTDAE